MTVYDFVMLAILLLCGLVGLRRGFVLTLCGLLAVVIALVGSRYAADQFAPAVTEAIAPRLETVISAQLDKSVDQTVDKITGADGSEGELTGVLGILQRSGMYNNALSDIQSAIQSGVKETADSAAASMALSMARPLSWGLVYSASFAVILLLWHLFSMALNLVVKLPVLRTFNRVLGGVCGLVKGLVIVGCICCVILFMGLLPAEHCRQSIFLQIFSVFTNTTL